MPDFLRLQPRDPLLFRDGRPFGFGQRMKGLPWATPSLVAGSLRSMLGKTMAGPWDDAKRTAMKQVRSSAALPLIDDHLYLPAPLDLVYRPAQKPEQLRAEPLLVDTLQQGEGVLSGDAASAGDQLLIAAAVDKPLPGPLWWRADRLLAWLCGEPVTTSRGSDLTAGFWSGAAEDTRTHVAIDPASFTARDGMLFQTIGRDMTLLQAASALAQISVQMSVRVDACPAAYQAALARLDELHPLGGERRLAHWRREDNDGGDWRLTQQQQSRLEQALAQAGQERLLRMVLLSPADFGERAWAPDWLKETDGRWLGAPPGSSPGLELELVAARVERWQAVSGWDYEKRRPKRLRRLVPAGSVYYFRLLQGDARELAQRWLQTAQGDEESSGQGFGLASWGIGFQQDQGVGS